MTESAQEALFGEQTDAPEQVDEVVADPDAVPDTTEQPESLAWARRRPDGYRPGMDVVHDEHGPGWVWGAGLGRVTVRFETRSSGPGPIRTLAADDPALHPVGIQPLARAVQHGDERDEALADDE